MGVFELRGICLTLFDFTLPMFCAKPSGQIPFYSALQSYSNVNFILLKLDLGRAFTDIFTTPAWPQKLYNVLEPMLPIDYLMLC